MPSRQPLGGKRRPAAPQMWQESNQTLDGWRSHHSRPTSNPKASLTRSGEANANCSAGWSEGGFRMCGLALALCRSAGYKRREKRRGDASHLGGSAARRLYRSFSSLVTRLVRRPQISPTRKSTHTLSVITSRM